MGEEIKKVGIVGAGFTGKQIAAQTALNNFIVKVYDFDPKGVEDAKKYITGVLKRKNKLDAIKNVSYYSDLREALNYEVNIFQAQLVKRMVRVANEIGREVATVNEAKEILGIKK